VIRLEILDRYVQDNLFKQINISQQVSLSLIHSILFHPGTFHEIFQDAEHIKGDSN